MLRLVISKKLTDVSEVLTDDETSEMSVNFYEVIRRNINRKFLVGNFTLRY